MTTSLLDVEDLNVSFHMRHRSLHAVRGITFTLHEGQTIGIVGESGCGKSAAAKALVQLHPRHNTTIQGKVLYKGQNLLELSDRQMQRVRGKEISMIFQDPMSSLNPTMKIGTQITEGIKRHHPELSSQAIRQQAIDMLSKVGIPSPELRFDAYPHTLSGGMRQRVMIALALVCQPHLLIADEPTTALDVTIQAQILDLLKKIKQDGNMSIILITHDLSVVAHFCDRVLVMYAGKIVEDAPVHQLFSQPQHPYTKRLLLAIPRLDQAKNQSLHPIEGMPPNLSLPLKGCGFCTRCEDAMHICAEQGPELIHVGPHHRAACFKHDKRARP